MANLGAQARLSDDDAGALHPVVDRLGVVVDVLEALSDVGGDLNAGEPGSERGEAGVLGVPEAPEEAGAGDVAIDDVDIVICEGGAEELHDAAMMAPAKGGDAGGQHGGVAEEGAAEHNGIAAA